ncbi:MAG: nucleotidyltransferase domain-containing protein [Chloroflexi bacterium]|nr:nucleotidyltransferase domain-containing protein [Chloroflexota bacterium]
MASVDGFLNGVADWGRADSHINAVILVGSQARGTATPTSDVDLVIITDNAPELLAEHEWARSFGILERWQEEEWGAVRSRRVWYADGLEVEFGFAPPAWLSEPLDEGTRMVVQPGFRVVYDPTGTVASRLRHALGSDAERP